MSRFVCQQTKADILNDPVFLNKLVFAKACRLAMFINRLDLTSKGGNHTHEGSIVLKIAGGHTAQKLEKVKTCGITLLNTGEIFK